MTTTTEAAHTAGAKCWSQGYCPNPWVGTVDGVTLKNARGGLRRFNTEGAALKAAKAAITAAEARANG